MTDSFNPGRDASLRRIVGRLHSHSRTLARMREEQSEILSTVRADLAEARARTDDSPRTAWLAQIAEALEVAQGLQESITLERDDMPPVVEA